MLRQLFDLVHTSKDLLDYSFVLALALDLHQLSDLCFEVVDNLELSWLLLAFAQLILLGVEIIEEALDFTRFLIFCGRLLYLDAGHYFLADLY